MTEQCWAADRYRLSSNLGIPMEGFAFCRDRVSHFGQSTVPAGHMFGEPIAALVFWSSQVSISQQHLSVIIAAVINVNTELRELERLRDQVKRKAQLLARRSRPKSRRKRVRL
jgi:hypothetical protein